MHNNHTKIFFQINNLQINNFKVLTRSEWSNRLSFSALKTVVMQALNTLTHTFANACVLRVRN